MKIVRRDIKKARIEMIPLIDVIFLLLVAFIFFFMSMTLMRSMGVALPSAETATVDKKDYTVIVIHYDDTIHLNKERVDLKMLPERLAGIRRESGDARVIISGDRKASYETVVTVMDAARMAGIETVSLETGEE